MRREEAAVVPMGGDPLCSCLTRECMAWVVAMQTRMDYRRTALEEVKTKLFGEARGRRREAFDRIQWSNTCPVLGQC